MPVDDVIHQYAQAKTRAIRLAQIVESEDDDVASLLTQKQPSALQDTHHAILLDAYDAANGNLRFLVTATQFQAMAGDTGVKLRPFQAHCWVQVGDAIVTDRLDVVRNFTPIRVV